MERKLRFLSNELEKAAIEVQPSAPVEASDPQGMYIIMCVCLVCVFGVCACVAVTGRKRTLVQGKL